MKLKSIIKIIFIGFFAVDLCSCAFGTREIYLYYPPQKTYDSGIAYDSENLRSKVILLTQIQNKRSKTKSSIFDNFTTDKEIIGHVRDGYFIKTANVVTNKNIEQWVYNAIAFELKNNGYQVLENSAQASDSEPDYILGGDTRKVYVDSFFNYTGKVKLHIVVADFRSQKILIDKVYEGKQKKLNLEASTEGFENVLEAALSKAIKKVIKDIRGLPFRTISQ